MGEIILEQDEFQIQYVGHDNNIPCFTLFDKTIKKYYLSEVNCSYEKLIKIWSKSRLKEHIYTNLIQSYKSEMIINHNISEADFFVPVDTSDNSLIFEKNDLIWFESSWNVWNKQSGNSIFNININSNKIREILFGPLEQNYDNLIIKNVNATDLYILPKIIVMDTPIKYFDFNINDIKDVDNNKNYELSLDEKSKINIDVPGINDNKYLNWVGMVYNKVLSGIVVDNNYIGGISSTLKNIINSNINDYGDVLSKINASNRPLVEKYVDDIMKKGKKISINISKKYVENDELIKLNINSSIYSGANSSSLIADGSHVGIYDISCIQKMNINFIEYKKF
ncbi:MAG: hypothetical protein HDR43_02965 [Mycoplasma sp.]|nr:hypothetical protein [Mycoplasma sp.]